MENDGQDDQIIKPNVPSEPFQDQKSSAQPQFSSPSSDSQVTKQNNDVTPDQPAIEGRETVNVQQPVQPVPATTILASQQTADSINNSLPWEKKAKLKRIIILAILSVVLVSVIIAAYLFYINYQKDRISALETVNDDVFSFKIPEGWVFEDDPSGDFPGIGYHPKEASYEEGGVEKYNTFMLHAADTDSLQGIKLSEIPLDQRVIVEDSISKQFAGNGGVGVSAAQSFADELCESDINIDESQEITTVGALGFRTSFECKTEADSVVTNARGVIVITVPERHSRMDIIFFVAKESVYDKNDKIIEDILSSGRYSQD